MGLVLVGGTIFLFAAVASKVAKESASNCTDAIVSLAGRGSVTGITPLGDKVQITLATNTRHTLVTVDRCSGHILQTLTIEP